MDKHPKQIAKLVIFLAILAGAVFICGFALRAKSVLDAEAQHRAAMSENVTEIQESLAAEGKSIEDIEAVSSVKIYILIAAAVAVVLLMSLLLKIPQALGTLFSKGEKASKEPVPSFEIPAVPASSAVPGAENAVIPDREITATAAPLETDSGTTAPNAEDIPPAESAFRVEYVQLCSEGRSLINWEGEW